MAWTSEVKEKRVAEAEVEHERATKSLESFTGQREELEAKLAKLTPEEFERRAERVRKAKIELDWRLAAPVSD